MPDMPIVAVTATTEAIRGTMRVRLNRAYTDALTAAGIVPVVIPPLAAAVAPRVLDAVDGLVLTGGEDVAPQLYGAQPHPSVEHVHAQRDASEIALLLEARRRRMPTLAICRGVQLLNVALGGTLVQDIPSERLTSIAHEASGRRNARVHQVCVDADSRLATALGAPVVVTNSMHHQSIDRLAAGLRVVARASDDTVEGVEAEDRGWWMLGVQWHPEELTETPEPWDRMLFATFRSALTRPAP